MSSTGFIFADLRCVNHSLFLVADALKFGSRQVLWTSYYNITSYANLEHSVLLTLYSHEIGILEIQQLYHCKRCNLSTALIQNHGEMNIFSFGRQILNGNETPIKSSSVLVYMKKRTTCWKRLWAVLIDSLNIFESFQRGIYCQWLKQIVIWSFDSPFGKKILDSKRLYSPSIWLTELIAIVHLWLLSRCCKVSVYVDDFDISILFWGLSINLFSLWLASFEKYILSVTWYSLCLSQKLAVLCNKNVTRIKWYCCTFQLSLVAVEFQYASMHRQRHHDDKLSDTFVITQVTFWL